MPLMLTIRSEQMTAFRRQLTADFRRRLISRLCRAYPARTAGMSSADLESLASAALANARSHGIVSEEDSFRFLDFALRYGPKFGEKDCTPWAHEILSTAHLGPDEKLNLLEGYELYGEGRVKT